MSTLLYFVGILVAIISLICSGVVRSRFNKWAKENSARGITGCQVVELMLRQAGIYDVSIVKLSKGDPLDNYYMPKDKTINLSETVYDSSSISAIAVAAHECGHAIQHHEAYAPLTFRNLFAPVASLGTKIAPLFFVAGLFLVYLFESTAMLWILDIGILAYSTAVIFYMVTLPVEFNASNRALKILSSSNVLGGHELGGAKSVLSAAAMTYVAAAAAAAIQLLRMLAIRGRD